MKNLTQRSFARRYLTALLAPALIAGAMQITWPFFQSAPVSPYFVAVIFCAWYGGLGPGLLAVVISFLLSDFLFTEPYFLFWPSKEFNLGRILLFAVVGPFISVISELMHRERRRAEINLESARQAEEARHQSDENYRALFEGSALPMWVYDIETLAFLAVNEAAVHHYGYSREEFLAMTIVDIRPPEDLPAFRAALAKAFAGINAVGYPGRHVKKNGSIIEVETTHNVLDFAGRPARLVVVNDVTERKQMENAIRSSEESLARAQEIAHLGNWDWDLLTNKVYWSEEMLDIYGITREEFGETYEAATSFTHPDDNERVRQVIEQTLSNQQPANFDYRIVRRDGTIRVMNAQAQVYVDKDGRVVKTAGTVQDITERKDAEEALRESESFRRTIIESEPECVKLVGPDCTLLDMNPAGLAMIGADSREQVVGQSVLSLIVPEWRDRFVEMHERVCQGESVVSEFEILGLKGVRRWMETHAVPLRNSDLRIIAQLAISRDITERKRAETRSAAFATLAGKLSGARVPLSAARTIADTAQELFGWESCALKLYDANQDLIHPLLYIDTVDGQFKDVTPDIAPAEPAPRSRLVIDHGAQLMLRKEPYKFDEDSVPFGDTHRPSASVMSVPIRHSSEVIGILSIQSYKAQAYDQEALCALQALADHCGAALNRIWAEEALRKSEERYRELFESAKDATYVHDLSGRYTSVNRAAEKLSGHSRADLIGRRFTDFVPPDQIEVISEHLCRKLVEEGETTYETEVIRSDGHRIPVAVSSHLIYENGAAIGVQGTARDIRERKRAEEALQGYPRQLIEAQETERQSIARELHDQIGQVLTAIRINLQTVWETCETSESRALIDEGVAIADEALQQVRDLSFELRPSLLDDLGLVAALRWYSDRFARRTGIRTATTLDLPDSKTRLGLELETACFRIVQEALTNVVRHASARKVSITLRNLKNDLCLSIRDDGKGFDAHSQNLSEFTTHVGLRGMRERALALGGRLEIKSSPSRGTEIRAYFPGRQ